MYNKDMVVPRKLGSQIMALELQKRVLREIFNPLNTELNPICQ